LTASWSDEEEEEEAAIGFKQHIFVRSFCFFCFLFSFFFSFFPSSVENCGYLCDEDEIGEIEV